MLAEENKALMRRYIEEVWDRKNIVALDEFLDPGYRRHVAPNVEPLTLDGQKKLLGGFRAAFPDVELTIEDIFAEDDRVALRTTLRGTHQGEFLGMKPTGREVHVALLDVFRVENGRFVEQWGGPNMLSLLQQLGAVVSPSSEE